MINTDFLIGYEDLNQHVPQDSFRVKVYVKDSFNEFFSDDSPYKGLKYIGSGNMNADVLIVGKEMAIDLNDFQKKEQYNYSVEKNIEKWDKICRQGYADINHANTEDKYNNYACLYSPVFPYYRQKRKINTDIWNNGGTSRTEIGYQKLIENIYNEGKPFHFFNLHEYAFLSELSTAVGRMSNQISDIERLQSLKERRILWNTDFFKSFPITILAVGHYIDIEENGQKVIQINKKEVEGSCFDVRFYKQTILIGKKFINIHFSEDTRGKERMLIHTNQFSFYSNDLVDRIGELCRIFLSEGKDATKRLVDQWLHK